MSDFERMISERRASRVPASITYQQALFEDYIWTLPEAVRDATYVHVIEMSNNRLGLNTTEADFYRYALDVARTVIADDDAAAWDEESEANADRQFADPSW